VVAPVESTVLRLMVENVDVSVGDAHPRAAVEANRGFRTAPWVHTRISVGRAVKLEIKLAHLAR
jgi:hypothetical protein